MATEKLIELVRDAIKWRPSIARVVGETDTKKIADHLIANGVTIQRWIPVTERLPQEDEPLGATCEQVQVLLADGTVTTGWCNRIRKLWYHLPLGDTHFYGYPYEHTLVVAWQPLAEPPKGA